MVKKRKKRGGSRIGVIAISLVVVLLAGVLAIKQQGLEIKNEEYMRKEEKIQKQIEEEEIRSKELEDYAKYVQTKKYVEEVAREKLGLVYPDEIMLKPES